MTNQSRKNNNSELIKKITGIGVFSALAFITTLVCKLIPNVGGFLSLDAKDAVIAIASFIYGPIAAPIIAAITSFIEFITISETGPWGLIMNFASSATFSLVASLIYKFFRSFNGAIIGFTAATASATAVMVALNPLIVPMYTGVSREVVVSMIPTLLLPFNFAKTLMNSAIAILLYKPIVKAMRAAHLVRPSYHKPELQVKRQIAPEANEKVTAGASGGFNKTTVFTLIVGGVSLFSAFAILLVLWL